MADYEKCTDEELIRRLRQGETEISDFLMMKYKELVRKKARAMFLIGGETDDLIQEGMIGLFKAVRDYVTGKEASFSTFAGICIERQLYNAIQGSNRQKHQPLNTYVSLSTEAEEKELRGELWADNPESIIIDRENVTDMRRQISQCLSKFENQVLEQYLQGYGYVQIAENMGKSPKSIDNALQKKKKKIREYLRKS